jgi:SNF2 family DNA or RNA helicase
MNRAAVEREAFNGADFNDCTVCALTNALDIPYALAYERMENFGRKYGKGAPITLYLDQFPSDYIRQQLPAGMRYQVRDFCNNNPYGRFIVTIDRHCFAIVDGKVQDIIDTPEEAYVKAAYKVQVETEEITKTRQTGKYKVNTSLAIKCPDCKKTAEVESEFKVANMTFTKYKCGHSVMNAQKTVASRFDEIKSITNRIGHTPFDFQATTVSFLEEAGLRGIVNHEMGLGKTIIECLLLKLHPDEMLPALIVTKAGLTYNVFKEVVNWTGDIPQILTTKKPIPNFDFHKIFIVSVDTLWRLGWGKIEKFDQRDPVNAAIRDRFKHVCIDEVQTVKNPTAQRTQAVKQMGAGKKVITLSGTPIKNNAGEYFIPLHLVRPDIFPTEAGFFKQHVSSYFNGYSFKVGGLSNPNRFKQLTNDWIIRFERSEVMPDLPKIFRQFQSATIEDKDIADAYENELDGFLDFMEEKDGKPSAQDFTNILAFFARMRHITGLAKIDPCVDFIREFLEEHTGDPDDIMDMPEKITIFAHHKDVIENLKIRLDVLLKEAGMDECAMITSDVKAQERVNVLDEMKSNSKRRVLIASTLAAGEGLNMQFMSNCIILERQWNPANEEQAEARFPRPGSTADQINAIYMLSAGTIDDMLTELVERKRAIMKQVLDGKNEKWDESSLMKDLMDELVNRGATKWRMAKN